jgi:hypothetical protein
MIPKPSHIRIHMLATMLRDMDTEPSKTLGINLLEPYRIDLENKTRLLARLVKKSSHHRENVQTLMKCESVVLLTELLINNHNLLFEWRKVMKTKSKKDPDTGDKTEEEVEQLVLFPVLLGTDKNDSVRPFLEASSARTISSSSIKAGDKVAFDLTNNKDADKAVDCVQRFLDAYEQSDEYIDSQTN